jgi:hypothetical protein
MESQKQLNYDLAMAFAAARLAKRSAEEVQEQATFAECPIDEMEFEMLREDFFNAYEYYRAQLPAEGIVFPLK